MPRFSARLCFLVNKIGNIYIYIYVCTSNFPQTIIFWYFLLFKLISSVNISCGATIWFLKTCAWIIFTTFMWKISVLTTFKKVTSDIWAHIIINVTVKVTVAPYELFLRPLLIHVDDKSLKSLSWEEWLYV